MDKVRIYTELYQAANRIQTCLLSTVNTDDIHDSSNECHPKLKETEQTLLSEHVHNSAFCQYMHIHYCAVIGWTLSQLLKVIACGVTEQVANNKNNQQS